MTRPAAWTDDEQRVICESYAILLRADLAGTKQNKSQLRRETLPLLNNRSAGSYEFKMCNISAALNDSGNEYIRGYKPRSGYQRSLLDWLAQCAPDLVPYQSCRKCDRMMPYTVARRPVCPPCQKQDLGQ